MALRLFKGKGRLPSNCEKYRYVNDPFGRTAFIEADDYVELENEVICPETQQPLKIVLHGHITEGMDVHGRIAWMKGVEAEYNQESTAELMLSPEKNHNYMGKMVTKKQYDALKKDPFHSTAQDMKKKMEKTYNEKPHIYEAHEKTRAKLKGKL
jgi:hypothetical protein